jgi:hypothetical protein
VSAMKIHGSEKTINKVFSDDFAFEIPHDQRPYRWTTEQAGEVLDDCSPRWPPTRPARWTRCRRTFWAASC